MHRTQILLDPSQYRRLKAKAAGVNLSLAGLIRRIVDRFLGESEKRSQLEEFCGVLKDRDCQSTNFKKFLYPDASKNPR